MSRPEQATDPFDPLNQWKAMRDQSMETWSKMMLEFVHSDAYASASARWLDSYLTLSQSFQAVVDQATSQTLSAYKVPSTDDINRLAERIWNVELKLDDLDARMDELMILLKEVAAKRAAPAPAVPSGKVNLAEAPTPGKEAPQPAKQTATAAHKVSARVRPAAKSPKPSRSAATAGKKVGPAAKAPAPVHPASKPAEPAASGNRAAEPASPVAKAPEAGKVVEAKNDSEVPKSGNGVSASSAPARKNGGAPARSHAAAGETKSKASGAVQPTVAAVPTDAARQDRK